MKAREIQTKSLLTSAQSLDFPTELRDDDWEHPVLAGSIQTVIIQGGQQQQIQSHCPIMMERPTHNGVF